MFLMFSRLLWYWIRSKCKKQTTTATKKKTPQNSNKQTKNKEIVWLCVQYKSKNNILIFFEKQIRKKQIYLRNLFPPNLQYSCLLSFDKLGALIKKLFKSILPAHLHCYLHVLEGSSLRML